MSGRTCLWHPSSRATMVGHDLPIAYRSLAPLVASCTRLGHERKEMMHIAICFFGITRSLRHTFPSIQTNILAPARSMGEVKIYSHFFRQAEVINPRNRENGIPDPEEYRLLNSDWLELEAPDICLDQWHFGALKSHGDFWKNDFVSLRNLVHQLHSLRRVTQAALADLPPHKDNLILFCRPDLRYHDAFSRSLRRAAAHQGELALVPRWQSWTGVNDRFAICKGSDAGAAYGMRIENALAYCETTGGPLHSERLLAFALKSAGIPVKPFGLRASRVRVDGTERWEDFARPLLSRVRRQLHSILRKGS
jgi:hypothetical protein